MKPVHLGTFGENWGQDKSRKKRKVRNARGGKIGGGKVKNNRDDQLEGEHTNCLKKRTKKVEARISSKPTTIPQTAGEKEIPCLKEGGLTQEGGDQDIVDEWKRQLVKGYMITGSPGNSRRTAEGRANQKVH